MRMPYRPRAALVVTAGALALSFVNISTASAAPGIVIMENGSQFKQVPNPQAGPVLLRPRPRHLGRQPDQRHHPAVPRRQLWDENPQPAGSGRVPAG